MTTNGDSSSPAYTTVVIFLFLWRVHTVHARAVELLHSPPFSPLPFFGCSHFLLSLLLIVDHRRHGSSCSEEIGMVCVDVRSLDVDK
jgi:hypothetical protein